MDKCPCFLCARRSIPHSRFRYALELSIHRFLKEDRYLSEHDLNERTQTHKLAEYLQALIPEYNVDCEYNKNLDEIKKLDFTGIVDAIKALLHERGMLLLENAELDEIIEQLSLELENSESIADEGELGDGIRDDNSASYLLFTSPNRLRKKYIKRVYPDIIAHHRGTRVNKVVIEAKKASNIDPKARLFDRIKLGLFTQRNGQFNYNVGFFVDLPSKKIPEKFKVRFKRDKLVRNSNVFIVEIAGKRQR